MHINVGFHSTVVKIGNFFVGHARAIDETIENVQEDRTDFRDGKTDYYQPSARRRF